MSTKFQITTSAYNRIVSTVGSIPAESGGILLGSPEDNIVRMFLFDENAKTTRSSYTFNTEYLNPEIERIEKEYGWDVNGLLHSHPSGSEWLSAPDKAYFSSILKDNPDVDYLLTPLVFSAVDGAYKFIPYIFHKDGRIEEAILEILPDGYACDSSHVSKKKETKENETVQDQEIKQNVPSKEIPQKKEEKSTEEENTEEGKTEEIKNNLPENNVDSDPVSQIKPKSGRLHADVSPKDNLSDSVLNYEKYMFSILKPVSFYLLILGCCFLTALFLLFLSLTPTIHSFFKTLLNSFLL